MYGGLLKIIYVYSQRQDLPLGPTVCFFATKYSHILSREGGGGGICETFFGEEGTDGSAVDRACWS
jgi:hypothetical protein